MGQHTDTLRQGYEAYGRGDLDAAAEAWHDDIRWEGTNSTRIPGGGVREGTDAVKQSLVELVQSFDDFAVSPDEFIEQDDTVVVLGHSEGTVRGGDRIKVPFVHIFRFRDGKAERVQVLTDTAVVAEALEKAGQ